MSPSLTKILIVDDESAMREGLKNFIDWQKHGYQIVGEATNGQDALTKITDLKPDIVISDIVMAKMDGVSLSQEMQKKFPDIKLVILSSFSNFDYVKTTMKQGAVDYILKPTLQPEELLKTLNKIKAVSSVKRETKPGTETIDSQLTRYLAGYDPSLSSDLITKHFPSPAFSLLVTNLAYYEQPTALIQTIETVLKELPQRITHVQLVHHNHLLYIFNSSPNELEKELPIFLDTHLSLLKNQSTDVFFVHSLVNPSLERLKETLPTLMDSLKSQRFYAKEAAYLPQADFVAPSPMTAFDIKGYHIHLNNQNFTSALIELASFIQQSCKKTVNEEDLKRLTSHALYSFFMSLEQSNFDATRIGQLKLTSFDRINSCAYLVDFPLLFSEITLDLEKMLQKQGEESEDYTQQLLDYIAQHFAEKITLNDLASHFHFNYHYLSSYFVTHLNESFTEYLNRVRIEKARKLIDEGTLNMTEISQAVGYSDVSYFAKVFKKLTGKTPTQARREVLKQ